MMGLTVWKDAWKSLRAHRLRTSMAMLGVVIGVAGVVVISGSARSGRTTVFSELESFGLQVVYVYRDFRGAQRPEQKTAGSGLDMDDVAQVQRECVRIRATAPVVSRTGVWAAAGSRQAVANLLAVGPRYFEIRRESPGWGRMLLPSDDEGHFAVAVLDQEAAERLFGAAEGALGREVRIEGLLCEVVGVLAKKERSFLSSLGVSQEGFGKVHVPIGLYLRKQQKKDVSYVIADVRKGTPPSEGARDIEGVLARRRQGRIEFTSSTLQDTVKSTGRILGIVEALGTVGAILALVVGGIGIMNILMASVLERTQEIGIRRALGATRAEIAQLFLCEGVSLAFLGGLVGIGLGLSIVTSMSGLVGNRVEVAWGYVVLAAAMAVLTGLLAAGYPARRAARLQPLEALRNPT